MELAADLRVRDWWRLAFAYSYLELDLKLDPGSQDQTNANVQRTDPRQQISLRSLMNPRKDIDVDLWLRYVDQTYPSLNVGAFANQRIPSYWELDLRLAWRPTPKLELSLVGQNLLHSSHPEGYQDAFAADLLAVERGLYASLRLAF